MKIVPDANADTILGNDKVVLSVKHTISIDIIDFGERINVAAISEPNQKTQFMSHLIYT